MSQLQKSASHDLMRRMYCVLLLLISALLLAGGAELVGLGGSPYYLGAGLLVAISAILLWRNSASGAPVYGLMLLATLPWAVWEAGANVWGLMPRLLAPVILGLPLLLPRLRYDPAAPHGRPTSRPVLAGVVGLSLALTVLCLLIHTPGPADPIDQTGAFAGTMLPPAPAATPAITQTDWSYYGHDLAGSRYSNLAQITPQNVGRLVPAWTFHVGKTFGLEVTPLKVGNALYICTSYNDVIALDAETGKQIWRFYERPNAAPLTWSVCRGVAYYRVPGATGPCAERIITNTADARLIALDAATGQKCGGFGTNGETSLLTGLSADTSLYAATSAPTIVHGKVVLGGFVNDGVSWNEPSGVVRAYDAVTGQLAWAWDMGRPELHGLPPAGQSYTASTPNAWGPFSGDEKSGTVFVPTGNRAVDYFGANRRPIDEKYGAAIVALDADTGNVKWSFQATHHDLWDYDNGSQPTLTDIAYKSGVRHALILPTKRGEIFVLDQLTGQPLSPVAEVPVSQHGVVPEEHPSPTQPFSVGMPSFRGPDFTERTMWGATPLDQLWCRIHFLKAHYEGTLTPPGLQWTIGYPGYNGGVDWGSISIDPARQLMFVDSSRVAIDYHLLTRAQTDEMGRTIGFKELGGPAEQAGTKYGALVRVFMSPIGIPCNQPPYGMLAAVDLPTGKLVWKRPLGDARNSGPWGIRSHLPLPIGVPVNGGSLATGGGLLFIAASQDGMFRAFEAATGKLMWSDKLPGGGQATPMTYVSPESGRQFVVIAAGGHPGFENTLGDSIVGYALRQ